MDIKSDYIVFSTEKLDKKIKHLEDENSSLKSQVDSLNAEIDSLKKILSTLNNRLKEITDFNELLKKSFKDLNDEDFSLKNSSFSQKKNFNTPIKSSEKTVHPSKQGNDQNTSTQQSLPKSIDTLKKNLVKEFNDLSGSTRRKFQSKNEVVILSCKNTAERLKNPSVDPVFESASQGGDFWAIPLKDNFFAVFPNNPSNGYNDNLHLERAFGVVFKSNFVEGEIYDKILVENPAVFEKRGDSWELRMQGFLKLE